MCTVSTVSKIIFQSLWTLIMYLGKISKIPFRFLNSSLSIGSFENQVGYDCLKKDSLSNLVSLDMKPW